MRPGFFVPLRLNKIQASVGLLLLVTVLSVHAAPKTPPIGHCNAQANIINLQGLNFGDIIAATAGIVAVDANGFRTSSGGVILAGGVVSEALFEITTTAGCSAHSHFINLPASIVLTSTTSSMTVDNFTSELSVPSLVDASGSGQVGVGASLNVNNSQASGNYSGQFTIEIVFQ